MPPIEAAPAAPVVTPAAAAPPPAATIPVAAKFSDVKAARREGAELALKSSGNSPPPATPKVEIDMTDAELAKATQLSKEARESKARAKELEATVAGTAKYTEAAALIAKGQHAAAARALGLDLNAAVAEELGAVPEGDAVDPKLAEMAKKLEALETGATARAKRDAEELAARTTEVRKQDVAAVVEHVKGQAATFPFLSRSAEWVQEAYDEAIDVYPRAVKDLGRDLNAQEKHDLITAALEEGEAKHAAKAKLYGATPAVALERPGGATPPRPSARPTTFDSSMRGGTSAATTKTKTRLTFHEAKRARRNAG